MIWKQEIDLVTMNKRGAGTFSSLLGIEFVDITDRSLTASMVVKKDHLQPVGIMHGGLSCALAETVGSAAANYCIPSDKKAFGLDINTNHLRPAKEGDTIRAYATPYHIGARTQVWEIRSTVEEKLVSVSRLTLFVQ